MNTTNHENETALLSACEEGNTDLINMLLSAGADPNIATTNGNSFLHSATYYNDDDSDDDDDDDDDGDDDDDDDDDGDDDDVWYEVFHGMTDLDESVDVNATDQRNQTALLVACIKRKTGIINILLNAGADPNIATTNGNTCLHYAACYGDSSDDDDVSQEVLQAIIDHGADVNAINQRNQTALLVACKQGNTGIINILLNAGADPNIATTNGNSCLHSVVWYGDDDSDDDDVRHEVFQVIIDHGADVNATNQQNETALLIACIKRNTGVINILLNAGADPNIATINGNTCLHSVARYYDDDHRMRFINNDELQDVLQALIDHGADVNIIDKKNETMLVLACEEGNTDIINMLLDAEVDPNIADRDGYTCLYYAAYKDCPIGVFQEIIDHGADVNATNKKIKLHC